MFDSKFFASVRGIFLILLSLALLSACDGNFLKDKLQGAMGKKTETPPVAPPVAPSTTPALPPPAVPPVTPPTQGATLPPDAPLGTPTLPPAAPPTVPGTPSLDDKIAEINHYLACINRTAPRTNDSYDRYLSWVSPSGPTCQEPRISYGLYSLYEDGIKKCQDAAQLVASTGPSYPKMEKALADIAAAYAQLVPVVQSAEDYYQQQDYKDDNCAKGKALHLQLMDAFGRFRKALAELQPELTALKEEVDTAELARMEAGGGKKLEWHTRKMSMDARELMETIPEDKAANFKPELYLAGYSKMDESYNAFTAYVTANPTEGEGVFWFSAFQNTAKGFYTKAKFLKRDLAEGKKPEPRGLQDVISEYNRLVGDFNNVRFRGM